MLNWFSEGLTNRLVKKEIISKEDVEVYQFGIECFLMKACHIISYLLIALCFHMVLELLVFLIAFIPLRIYSGGYHAKTEERCYIISCCAVLIALCLIRFTPVHIMQYGYIVSLVGGMILSMIVPVETSNKPLDKTENTYYKKKARAIIMIELGLIIIFKLLLLNHIGFILTLCITYELAIALIGIKNTSQANLGSLL